MDDRRIQQIIQELEQLNLEEISTELLKPKVVLLLSAHPNTSFILQPGPERLYRAVLHTDETNHTDRLKYPPEDKVEYLGRANLVGQSIFYGASEPRVTFFEREAKPGEVLAISEWRVTKPIPIHLLGYTEYILQQAKSTRPLPGSDLNHPHRGISSRTNDFLHELFMKSTEDSKHAYKLTSMISQHFYSFGGGIAYPTVKMHGNAENFALPAKIAKECLELVRVKSHPVRDYKPYSGNSKTSFYYDFDFPSIADNFDNGTIHWRKPTAEEEHEQRIICRQTIPNRIYDHNLKRFRDA